MGNKQSIYFRVITSLIIVTVVSLVAMFLFFYPMAVRSAYRNQEERNRIALDHTVQAMDKLLNQYSKIAVSIEYNALLRPYAMKDDDVVSLYNGSKQFHNYFSTQSDAHCMFLHLIGSQYVIGGEGAVTLEDFNRKINILGHLDQASLMAILSDPAAHHLRLFPVDSFSATVSSSKTAVLPFVLAVSSSGKTYGTLLVLLKASDLEMELMRAWESGVVFIADRDRILYSTQEVAPELLAGLPLSAPVEGRQLPEGASLSIAVSKLYDLSYGVITRPDVVARELHTLRTTVATFLIVTCGMIFFIVFLLSRWNYQPVRQLVYSVGIHPGTKGNDSELLRERFSALMSLNADLGTQIQQSQSLLQDAIFHRFLLSHPQERERLVARGIAAGVFSSAKAYTLAVAVPGTERVAEDWRRLPTAPAAPRPLVVFEATQGEHIVVLLQWMNELPAPEDIHGALSGGSPANICYAPLVNELCLIPDVYGRMSGALRTLRELKSPFLATLDELLRGEGQAMGDEEVLDKLSQSIEAQQADEFRLAVSLMCTAIEKKSGRLAEARGLAMEALLRMCRALEQCQRLDAALLKQFNPLAGERLRSAETMQTLLRYAADQVLKGFPSPARSGNKKLPQEVLLYIDEHLLDASFSIYTASGAFDLSESAFSHLFKRTFGSNFSTYVNQQKLIHAFALLSDTDLSLEEIAERLGYSRASNFGRMFKAEVGMSPGKYRSLYGDRGAIPSPPQS